MIRIKINTTKPYSVLLGKGILTESPALLKKECGLDSCKLMLVSDSNVFPLYGAALTDALTREGFEVFSFVFPAGEKSKNLSTLSALWDQLAKHAFSRSDILLALGGGVVGDITGFAASVYLRGIKYIQFPTSLLAMVDSSVGGKTAVDIETGKNLIGAFYQPELVICDIKTLDTLPADVFSDGMAEVIKYAMIDSGEIFDLLQQKDPDIEKIIALSIYEKKEKVERDEYDRDVRRLLNFGHTAGHAIEVLSGFTVSHGKAVAMGMMMITRAAIAAKLTVPKTEKVLYDLLTKYSLPTESPYSIHDIAEFTYNDKKREGNTISLIIPVKPGKCIIHKTNIDEYSDYLKHNDD